MFDSDEFISIFLSEANEIVEGLENDLVLLEDNKPVGLLRYNLFWDKFPFCTMLFIEQNYQRKGYGRKLMEHWENDMKSKGYGMLLTSTQVDENAQHFYRKLGYKDCGGLVIDVPEFKQPMELFLVKGL